MSKRGNIPVFISYSSSYDSDKMNSILKKLNRSWYFKPIVVDKENLPDKEFGEKVITFLSACKYFIPILTKKSYKNQWVNQEIGFANRLQREKVINKIIPVVERKLLDLNTLKGFIHSHKEVVPFEFTDINKFHNVTSKKILEILNKDYYRLKETIKEPLSEPAIRITINKNSVEAKIAPDILGTNNQMKIERSIRIFIHNFIMENLTDKKIIIIGINFLINFDSVLIRNYFGKSKFHIKLKSYSHQDDNLMDLNKSALDLNAFDFCQINSRWDFLHHLNDLSTAIQVFNDTFYYIESIDAEVITTMGRQKINVNLV